MKNETIDNSTPLNKSYGDLWMFALETSNGKVFCFSNYKDHGDSITIYDQWGDGSGSYDFVSDCIVPDKRGIQIFKAHIIRVWDCSGKT